MTHDRRSESGFSRAIGTHEDIALSGLKGKRKIRENSLVFYGNPEVFDGEHIISVMSEE